MKTKVIPVILALIAGLITCIASIVNGLSPRAFVKALLLVVLAFLAIGFIWKIILDRNFPPEEEPQPEGISDSKTEDEDREAEEGESPQESVEMMEDGEDEEW